MKLTSFLAVLFTATMAIASAVPAAEPVAAENLEKRACPIAAQRDCKNICRYAGSPSCELSCLRGKGCYA
ncbi:hypothetical protein BJ508DRAFT_363197 [Ascobolus immersus RN42]|uniref:WAP domain-containing protein n=1 Tax=Ascobolus immersus RN42 TaxID=1160509 RepID=A0A3N4I468_ASCIM|nr:hypothetical protein BJ508DRAFT_363197 [Ascobolus immersus RN42]